MSKIDDYGKILKIGYKQCSDLLEGHAELLKKDDEFTANYLLAMADIIKKALVPAADLTVKQFKEIKSKQ